MNKINAIVWDYDGTLADTHQKNLNVTKKIIKHFTGTNPSRFGTLHSLDKYAKTLRLQSNWREFYQKEFNFNQSEIDEVGALWTRFQLEDNTTVPFFEGISRIVKLLDKYPQGIVSQNSKRSIALNLTDHKLIGFFNCIIGYEEVGLEKQKPDPAGMILCIQKLTQFAPGKIIYIGDHLSDVLCAENANNYLKKMDFKVKVSTIGMSYNSEKISTEEYKFDYFAHDPEEILKIITKLTDPH